MKLDNSRSRVFTLLVFLLVSVVHADSGQSVGAIPRSFGPLTLGMTEQEFRKITGPIDIFACHHCVANENMVAVNIEKYPGVFPSYLYSLAKYQRGLDCSFFKGRLYKIATFPEVQTIGVARGKYTDHFGSPPTIEDWQNGLSFAAWEDKKTAFVLTYV